MEIVLVENVEDARKVTAEGKLPAVDVTTGRLDWLVRKLHTERIRQATMQECVASGIHTRKGFLGSKEA